MNDLQELIETTLVLCQRLDRMAENERKFGADLCHLLEQISYDMFKSANELKEISTYAIGDVA